MIIFVLSSVNKTVIKKMSRKEDEAIMKLKKSATATSDTAKHKKKIPHAELNNIN